MTMAEELRLYSSPEWLEDMAKLLPQLRNPAHRAAPFHKREIEPLGAIFRAISKMPEKSAADVRGKDEAFDAAIELMKRLFEQLLLPHGSFRTSYDDDVARLQAMAKADVDLFAHHASENAQTTRRLELFLRGEMGPLEDVLFAILSMPESSSADDVRVKNEAFDAAMYLLERMFPLHLPHGSPSNAVCAASQVRKGEPRAAAKEMINRHLDQMLPRGPMKIDDEL